MSGRNGTDQLTRFISILSLVTVVGNLFIRSLILWLLAIVELGYCYFRMFSKNVYKRREENGRYLRMKYDVSRWFSRRRDMWHQRKEFKFFRCPACKAYLRVPRGKGKIRIVCKKCGNAFETRT